MCPGRVRSRGPVSGLTIALIVADRSPAEIPVVVSPTASMETVNAVLWESVFSNTIKGRPSSSSRSPVVGRQMRPLVWRTMNATFSGVTFSAAMIRSPSFSRSSSSTTSTNSPAAMAASASSTVAVFTCSSAFPHTLQEHPFPNSPDLQHCAYRGPSRPTCGGSKQSQTMIRRRRR